MTEQNMKKLYEHYVLTGQVGMANDILKVYPQFKPVVEEEKVETKSKEKK